MSSGQLINRQVVLAAHPRGPPQDSDFRLEQVTLSSSPGPHKVLLKTLWLSLDPYMRGRMSQAASYAKGAEVGDVLPGGTVSEVIASEHPDYAVGDIVEAKAGWQEYIVSDGQGLRKIDPHLAPVTTALGVLGMPGMTAYVGLRNIGQPKAGETVVVAAASGAVGAVVGQLCKQQGCRVVGIAGGPAKCAYVKDCVDHKKSPEGLAQRLREACPKGIDLYWENVGGEVWKAVFPFLNWFARVPVCGLIAHYNDSELPPGPDRTPELMRKVLTHRLRLQGFIVYDYREQQQDFLTEVGAMVRNGTMKYKEDIVQGLENAPRAFQGLLRGDNFGKVLIKVADASHNISG